MPNTLGTPLPNGSKLPSVPFLLSFQAEKIKIEDARRANGIVVGFIHGTWCPYCVTQLSRLNKIAPELEKRNVGLVCISHDPEPTISAFQVSAKPQLRYPLMEDSEPSVAHLFGIFDNYPEHMSPYPAVFYADKDNIIRYSDVSSDPDCHPNLVKLLEAIDNGI